MNRENTDVCKAASAMAVENFLVLTSMRFPKRQRVVTRCCQLWQRFRVVHVPMIRFFKRDYRNKYIFSYKG